MMYVWCRTAGKNDRVRSFGALGLWAACESISTFAGITEYEKLFHRNVSRVLSCGSLTF